MKLERELKENKKIIEKKKYYKEDKRDIEMITEDILDLYNKNKNKSFNIVIKLLQKKLSQYRRWGIPDKEFNIAFKNIKKQFYDKTSLLALVVIAEAIINVKIDSFV